jgi:hypothetical protein
MAGRCLSGSVKDKVAKELKSVRLFNVPTEAEKSIVYKGGGASFFFAYFFLFRRPVLEIRSSYAHGLSGAFSDSEIRQTLSQ